MSWQLLVIPFMIEVRTVFSLKNREKSIDKKRCFPIPFFKVNSQLKQVFNVNIKSAKMGQETSKPKLTCRLSELSYLDIEELVAIYRGKGNM